ncbi:MAG: zinc ribbon domain-containing protein [Deltaproteobacteria bacterium]|nr:zinc ribbon domain-containing protein [Deltaproteobacteria bacterium]
MQPKKVQVDDQPRPCPNCGLPSARLKRLDHYLSLFFIPLIPIRRGERFLECNRCGRIFEETGRPQWRSFEQASLGICPRCRQPLASDFKYCPYCGQRVS